MSEQVKVVERNTSPQDPAPSCLLVILGASGDLTKRLLLPSLYNLASIGALADGFRLLGVANETWDDSAMRDHVKDAVQKFWGKEPNENVLGWILQRTLYQQADLKDSAAYESLARRIQHIESEVGAQAANRLFYLALAPSFIQPVASQLASVRMFAEDGGSWSRLIIEKPFGHDRDSAVELTRNLKQSLTDEQIFRIDHFSGKEALHDIAIVRFANPFIEALWRRGIIDNVQITVAETIGVEQRATFYEKSGALRDMVPNHIAELISVVAMERPCSSSTEDVRSKQVEVLQSVKVIPPDRVTQSAVRAQYTKGTVKGQAAIGYREEPNVAPDSTVETYAALRLEIDNERWAGVPFYVRTGKRLAGDMTEVVLEFKRPADTLFAAADPTQTLPHALFFRLKPGNGVHLQFGAKKPGMETTVVPASMIFEAAPGPFGDHGKGYERLLRDAMLGNKTLFQREDFVEAGWRMVQPLIDAWKGGDGLTFYPAGSSGPAESDALLERDGRRWRSLEDA